MGFWEQAAKWSDFRPDFWPDFAALTRRMAADETELRQKFWRKLKREVAGVPFLEDVLTAYYCAFDRNTPIHVKAVSLFSCRDLPSVQDTCSMSDPIILAFDGSKPDSVPGNWI